MRNPRELTRAEIIRTAGGFRWNRKMPKWTAIIEGRELPARPLVLEAAGVPPNDATNSHQAIDILKRLGFETRYTRERIAEITGERKEFPEQGNALDSILEIANGVAGEVPEEKWQSVPEDLAVNLDHYLYGSEKDQK